MVNETFYQDTMERLSRSFLLKKEGLIESRIKKIDCDFDKNNPEHIKRISRELTPNSEVYYYKNDLGKRVTIITFIIEVGLPKATELNGNLSMEFTQKYY